MRTLLCTWGTNGSPRSVVSMKLFLIRLSRQLVLNQTQPSARRGQMRGGHWSPVRSLLQESWWWLVAWHSAGRQYGKKGVDSLYILKVEPEGFVGGWDVAHERGRSQDDCKALDLRNWKDGVALTWIGKTVRRTEFTRKMGSWFHFGKLGLSPLLALQVEMSCAR